MRKSVKLKSKDAEALREFLDRLRQVLAINLIEVKLFGSKATGKDQRDSDIDVLVAVENGGVEIEDQVLEIAFDVNLKHDVYVSPRVIDRATLSDRVWSIIPFLRAIAAIRRFSVNPELEKLARHRLSRAQILWRMIPMFSRRHPLGHQSALEQFPELRFL